MKLLTVTSLLLIVACRGEMWNISFPQQRFRAKQDQDVIIPCSFTYPSAQHTDNVQVYWKKLEGKKMDIEDNDKNAFIYHQNETYVLEKYRGRTRLTGTPAQGNCTLMIKRVTEAIRNIYVRVIGKNDQYSFIKNVVSIVLADAPEATSETRPTFSGEVFETPETSTTQSTTRNKPSSSSSLTYTAIFVPVAALVVIIFVTGIVFCIRRKRSKSFTRQDSGYYVNVGRTPSNQTQREASGKQDNKKQSEPKVIDEPVYINMQVPQQEMDQRPDHIDSVYANIDYTK